MSSVHDCNSVCHCHSSAYPSVHQTLEELDFERGLWNAALCGDVAEVEKKLTDNSGSNVNTPDKSGYTALHYASRNGHLDVVKTLLKFNASVNAATSSSKATPLHRAAYMGHSQIVSLLLGHGAEPALQDCDGMTSLHKASEKGNLKTVELLLVAGPSIVNTMDNRGRTPQDLASSTEIRKALEGK